MSTFVKNKSCDMCQRVDVGLTEMTIGKTKHHLCYDCIAKFTLDLVEFASMNSKDEFEKGGYIIAIDNNGGFIIKKKER